MYEFWLCLVTSDYRQQMNLCTASRSFLAIVGESVRTHSLAKL